MKHMVIFTNLNNIIAIFMTFITWTRSMYIIKSISANYTIFIIRNIHNILGCLLSTTYCFLLNSLLTFTKCRFT